MEIADILGLAATDDPHRWRLPLRPEVLTYANALHGGCGLAAAVEAMARTTERPLVWAAAQYLTHAGPPGSLDLEVNVEVHGRHLTQARCVVRLGDEEILTAHGALGTRSFEHEAVWSESPTVPPPDACPVRDMGRPLDGVLGHWDMRLALGRSFDQLDGTPGPGRSASWYHVPGGARMVTAGDLSILGDFLMIEISDAMGFRCSGNSLDNTIRIAHLVPTEWVLLDARLHAVANGFACGTAHLWSEDGTLLGIASQSLVVRDAMPDGRAVRTSRRMAGRDGRRDAL